MEPLDIEDLKEKAEPAHQVDSDPKGDTVKTRITFEVDTNELFDTLQKMNGNTAPIGERIVGVMLADDGFFNKVGMAVYGVTVIDRKPADAAPASASAFSELSRLRSENEGMRKALEPFRECVVMTDRNRVIVGFETDKIAAQVADALADYVAGSQS